MTRCLQCARPVAGARAYCPACLPEPAEGNAVDGLRAAAAIRERAGVAAEAEDLGLAERGFVPIARFRNAAEAGYFADELARAGDFQAVVDLEEALDSFGHYWTTRFVLWVPRGEAEAATRQLQQLVETTDSEGLFELPGEEPAVDAASEAPANEPVESGVNWVPIVLTLAAGSVALWVARSMNEQPPKRDVRMMPAGGLDIDLWERLSVDPAPWVQESDGARRELQLSHDGEAAILREDLDGDGLFERVVRIRRAAPVW